MTSLQDVRDEIKLKLTGDLLEFELEDEQLEINCKKWAEKNIILKDQCKKYPQNLQNSVYPLPIKK